MADDNNAAVQQAMMLGGMYGPNPYSQFPKGVQGTSFVGPATDAYGKTIDSYAQAQAAHDAWQPPAAPAQGTTLNNTGQTYGLQPSQLAGPSALNPSGNQAFGMSEWGGMMSPQARDLYRNQQFAPPGSERGQTYANMGQQAAPAAPATNPIDMNKAYMTALANPGPVTTPGATVPQSPPVTQQPSVLDQFLATQKGSTSSAPGSNYSNQPFFDTLNKLKGMA